MKKIIIYLFIISISSGQAFAEKNDKKQTAKLLSAFGEVFELIKRDYVEETSDVELIEAAISGMLSSLDPHSNYLNAKTLKDFNTATSGQFGGLGMEVTLENGFVKVIAPLDDTPASRAGILSGDVITHIDGDSVQGLSLNEAVEKMRGRPGTNILISIFRENKDPFELKLKRESIQIKSVKAKLIDDVGYLRITSFTKTTTKNLNTEVKKLKKQAKNNKTPLIGFVIDLRNNPGGLLQQAISVSDAFLVRGEIVSTRGRDEKDSFRAQARANDISDGLPLIVLINSGSASASEIVAGALQDHKRAVIVGTNSFGKGSVQNIKRLKRYPSAAIKLTVQRYYTPSGKSIQAEGIKPDVYVPLAKVEILEHRKRFEKDLKGALDSDKTKKTPTKTDQTRETASDDYQLARGLDILRGIATYKEAFAK